MTFDKPRRLLPALLVAAALVFAAAQAWAGGVLKIAREQDSTTFDPIYTILAPDIWVFNQFYSTLVRANADATGIEPDLAETWEISPDGTVYTFHLREAKFSDGTPVLASDVVFSLLRARDDEKSVLRSMFSPIDKAEAPDDRTVVLRLKGPSAPLMSTLAMFAASILPEHAVKAEGEAFGEKPVGSGAFVLKEWKRGDSIILARNPLYWEKGLPKLDGIEWIYVPNDNTRMLKLKAGEVDAATFVPWNQIKELQADKNIQVQLDKSTRMDHILVNHAHKPLDNKLVRQALNMAIDQKAIVDVVTQGFGTPANSFFPLDGMDYNPANPNYPYDPEKAKKILEEQGVKDLTLSFALVAGDTAHDQIGVLVKDQLAKIGVTVNLNKMEGGQQWDALVNGDYDIGVMWWVNDVFDPDEKAQFCVSGDPENRSYYTNYKNPVVTDLVNKAAVEQDPEKRKQMYYEIQRIAKDDVHWIDLYYSPFRNASRSNVKGFVQNPLGRYMLETADIVN
ncbi:MAG TPA: ABC transporter substrate-binding protein [Hypericibacter adhaerens]|uniref:ABC transporter substrate-binding protein n=1 Tax=Hypericibacter adhaerens TaxID=2602016 RepID=UPI002B960D59|nr:ABC transporter substrate-binding protein [Hypericibacter adhaerens]HWA42459.1 ABC transporter substrate-binding protein [Hypericibacter adhaerens]